MAGLGGFSFWARVTMKTLIFLIFVPHLLIGQGAASNPADAKFLNETIGRFLAGSK